MASDPRCLPAPDAGPAAVRDDPGASWRGLGDGLLEWLVGVAEEINSTLDVDQVLARVAERVKTQVDYDTFAVLLLDDLGRELHFRFALGFREDVVRHWRFGLGQGIVGTAVQKQQTVRVDDVQSDARYIRGAEAVASELAIPLVVKNRAIGVLDVQSSRPRQFGERDQRLLAFLGGHLANAIENARLYQNVREQSRVLSLLHEMSRELAAILDREELFRKVAQLVKRLVPYQVISLMLWNEQSRVLDRGFSVRLDERFSIKDGFPLGHGITGTAAALRQPIRVPNVHLDPRYVSCGGDVEVRSELAVPLVFEGRLVGVLDLESGEYNAFTEKHEHLLATLASNVAIALENARLYEKLREDERRLEQDLATAREVQRGLMARVIPQVPGLEVAVVTLPARHVGGDLYDVLPYGDGRLAIAAGDVSGKATGAALYGSLAVGILRGHVVEHPCEPRIMLEKINRHLAEPQVDGRYVALAYAVVDGAARTLTVGNAGFPRPHRVRGGSVEEIPVQGVPLGLFPESVYEQLDVALEEGDLVVFCSDGVPECRSEDGREFGRSHLVALLEEHAGAPAQAVADAIVRATERHAEGVAEVADDRTVVAVRVVARPPSTRS